MKHLSSGFTLIELLVVIVIVGVSLAIGLPSYTPMISKVRMDGELSTLVASLNFARSEAQKRGLPVVVCPGTESSTTCGTGTNWSNGWIVLLNTTPTQVLQVNGALSRDVLGSTSTASTSYPQFTPMGYTFFDKQLVLRDVNDTSNTSSTVNLRRCLSFSAGNWTSKTGTACPSI